jgi:hypothetical protein
MNARPSLYDELCDLERRVGALREHVRLAGLLELDNALTVPHEGLAAVAEACPPSPVEERRHHLGLAIPL